MKKLIQKWLAMGLTFMLVALVFVGISINSSSEFIGDITILPDGTVDPPDAPLLQDGDTYTLTDNVTGSIIIQKSGITLDGDGSAPCIQ